MRKKVLLNGYDILNDHELLELLLFNVFPQGDTNVLAHNLINHFGSLKNVLEASPLEISNVKGFGEKSGVFIGSLLPVIKRYLTAISDTGKFLENVDDVKKYARNLCIGNKVECVYAIYLNKSNKLISTTKISTGGIDSASADIERIVHEAILHKAYYVIIVHNHPSGVVFPSNNDELITYEIQTKLANFRRILLDSVIVSDLSTFSMYEHNYFQKMLKKYSGTRVISEEAIIKEEGTLFPDVPEERYKLSSEDESDERTITEYF